MRLLKSGIRAWGLGLGDWTGAKAPISIRTLAGHVVHRRRSRQEPPRVRIVKDWGLRDRALDGATTSPGIFQSPTLTLNPCALRRRRKRFLGGGGQGGST